MRVLIVDDSPVLRTLLHSVLQNAGMQVREAESGEQALKILASYTPDIITMDVHMPGMDGYEATARILERHALPVLVLTASANVRDASTAMRALEAGALAVLEKPAGPDCADFDALVHNLLRTLRSLAQVKIVRRPRKTAVAQSVVLPAGAAPGESSQLVAIAASAGGPAALKLLLQPLAPAPPWPLLLAQHISAGFIESFRDWLASICTLPIHIATDGQALRPGELYLAPESYHLGVSADLRVALQTGRGNGLFCPSANHLFESVAQCAGSRAIAIQLSGMGRDGAEGLATLHRCGALTIAQEPASAVIDAMPLAAINLNACSMVLPPEGIALLLNSIALRHSSFGTAPEGVEPCSPTPKS